MEGFQDLGQRIVQAARLAVAVHFYESVTRTTAPDGAACRVARQILRRRVAIGGAGLHATGDACIPRLGDLVTDDERDGLIGVGDSCDDLDDADEG